MAIHNFPPVENADEDGLLAMGGDLDVSSLILAYKNGIFPWPISKEFPLCWFSPDPRGILRCNDLHVSKSMKKLIRQNKFTVKFNTNFEEVIVNCAKIKRKNQPSTWITNNIIKAYIDLHYNGYAYSVETYNCETLVGGMYGFHYGNIISGESMFSKESNSSKLALITLIKYLKKKDIELLDTQMLTPVVADLGGTLIKREDFVKYLHRTNENCALNKLFMDCHAPIRL